MNRNGALAGLGAVLLMVVCCAAPLLVLAGAATGPAALLTALGVPTIAAVVVGVIVAVGIVLWRRRIADDCADQPTERDADLWKARPGR